MGHKPRSQLNSLVQNNGKRIIFRVPDSNIQNEQVHILDQENANVIKIKHDKEQPLSSREEDWADPLKVINHCMKIQELQMWMANAPLTEKNRRKVRKAVKKKENATANTVSQRDANMLPQVLEVQEPIDAPPEMTEMQEPELAPMYPSTA